VGLPHGITVVVTASGLIRFAPQAASVLAAHLPGIPAEHPIDKIPDLTSQLLALRDKLRAMPA
jgi:hypothetical protein